MRFSAADFVGQEFMPQASGQMFSGSYHIRTQVRNSPADMDVLILFAVSSTVQISALLQAFPHADPLGGAPIQVDPYPSRYLGRRQQHFTVLDADSEVLLRREVATPNLARVLDMPKDGKIVACFLGKVESVHEDGAIVSLMNEATRERVESKCDSDVLRENGIRLGDEFRCEVVRVGGTALTKLSKLPPKTVPKEKVQELRAKFRDRWNFSDPKV